MATRERRSSATETGAEDLEVLYPNQQVTIAGEDLIVREYGFVESMKLRPLYAPMLDALYGLMESGRVPDAWEVDGILAENHEQLVKLLAVAADVSETFVASLGSRDGQTLRDAWWVANGPFFLRNVTNRLMAKRVRENHLAGRTASRNSSAPDTTRSESGATPTDKSNSGSVPPVAPKTGKEASD